MLYFRCKHEDCNIYDFLGDKRDINNNKKYKYIYILRDGCSRG